MHMTNSQDQVGVVEPKTSTWKVAETFVKESRVELVRDTERISVRCLDKETLALLAESEVNALDCTVLTFEDKHTLLRVAQAKEKKRK